MRSAIRSLHSLAFFSCTPYHSSMLGVQFNECDSNDLSLFEGQSCDGGVTVGMVDNVTAKGNTLRGNGF